MRKKTVGEFLEAQGCFFVKMTINNKVYFCEYTPQTIMWHGEPVEVGLYFKDMCIVTELDETTVVNYHAASPMYDFHTEVWAVKLWEEAHGGMKAGDCIVPAARAKWLKACEEM